MQLCALTPLISLLIDLALSYYAYYYLLINVGYQALKSSKWFLVLSLTDRYIKDIFVGKSYFS